MSDRLLATLQSRHIVSIHILDDYSLLNIFYLYRPFFLGEGGNDFERFDREDQPWVQGRWWYGLAHVCKRWRNVILGSSSYLRLSLICTNGTPVANMLEHSPPLPLTVDYRSENGITAEDEEGILLALEQRHRVRHLRLLFPLQNLPKLVMAIDEEFPILEYLIVYPLTKNSTALGLPGTLQAPHLRHLALSGFACPIRPRLHPTAASLVTLYLMINHQSPYFQPNILLQWISSMPLLESLAILFTFAVPNRDVERQLTHTPITTPITLPNLRLFSFRGVSAYLEAVVCRITAPRLEDLKIRLFKQLTFSVPRLAQFMHTIESLRFDKALIKFKDKQIDVLTFFREADTCAFAVTVDCWHLDWQVSSVAQICNALSQVFSAVGYLTLEHEVPNQSSEEHNDLDRIEWRKLLRSFSNVKTFHIGDGLVEKLSRCLRLEDGELPLELLPELQELTYFRSPDTDAFTSFIDARQNTNHPVMLRHRCPVCQRTIGRVQELNRHIKMHLPDSIHCPFQGCTWTGHRKYAFKSHWIGKHPEAGQAPGEDANEIYDPKVFVKSILDGTPVDDVARSAFAMAQEGLERLGKPYAEASVLGSNRRLRRWIFSSQIN